MIRTVSIAAIAALLAVPAFAGGAACTNAPHSQWQSKAALTTMLKSQGLTVRRIKTEGGCYESYSVDKNGNQVNAAYNAKTFQKVAKAEAGEG
ncbi:MAG: PepSY domain-containing protein [Alphaproteobacteria bacterium]|nr:PepSY domain-containing protein [Alphaproteobacteria bacterium]